MNFTKTRFAPSPTGAMHIGNARTALFNFLFAKRSETGAFLLRIEDTDKQRSSKEHYEQLLSDLKALSLLWDEGGDLSGKHAPYRQSQRNDIYQTYLQQLLEQGNAYPCFCTTEELEDMRLQQKLAGQPPRYDGRWRNADPERVQQKKAEGIPFTIRFKVPESETLLYDDDVKGAQRFNSEHIGDFILTKEDGSAAFFFANAVDDALMGVTHVLRGDDHLTNTPRQIMILQALGLAIPSYGHTSTILGGDGKPLSKRNGSQSIKQMLSEGWLPLAIVNYFARLGHYYPDNNLMSLSELSQKFSIKQLSKSAARYDEDQLKHWQKEAIQQLSESALQIWLSKTLDPLIEASEQPAFIEIIKDNILLPQDALVYANVINKDAVTWDESGQSWLKKAGGFYFETAQTVWGKTGSVEAVFSELKAQGHKGKALFMPLRVALTGLEYGPELSRFALLIKSSRINHRLALAQSICS